MLLSLILFVSGAFGLYDGHILSGIVLIGVGFIYLPPGDVDEDGVMSVRNKMWRWIIIIGVVLLIAAIYFRPETFHTPLNVPVSVTVRNSYVGIGNVVQIRNTSKDTLTGVVVKGDNPRSGETAKHSIGMIAPGNTVDVGWTEWNWKVSPGETITISSNGYLSIVFSSEQLGIR